MRFLIAIPLILITLAGIIWGAILPFAKSRMYVEATKMEVVSLEEFERVYDAVLEFPSPVGNEEAIRFLGSIVEGIIVIENQPEDASVGLVKYWEERAYKDDIRHLIILSALYRNLWVRFEREEYFRKAEEYALAAESITPNLPQALYSLYNLYTYSGDGEKAREYAEKILSFWPDDERIREFLED